MTVAHGTESRYANHKCRCADCTEGHRVYLAKRRVQRYAYVAANGLPSSVEHGASAYGNWGCRCDICTRASSTLRLRLYHQKKAS